MLSALPCPALSLPCPALCVVSRTLTVSAIIQGGDDVAPVADTLPHTLPAAGAAAPGSSSSISDGITITFKDVCYFVPNPSAASGGSGGGGGSGGAGVPAAELQLLHNITGSFRPGVLTALMVS